MNWYYVWAGIIISIPPAVALWEIRKMWAAHQYLKRYRRMQEMIMEEPDSLKRLYYLTQVGPPKPPYL